MTKLQAASILALLTAAATVHAQPGSEAPPAPVEQEQMAPPPGPPSPPTPRGEPTPDFVPPGGVDLGPPPPPEPPPPPPVKTGFALELRLETGLAAIDEDLLIPGSQAGVFLGYRSSSFTIGLGFDLQRVTEGRSDSTSSADQSLTRLLVIPGLRLVLARTDDARTELLAQLDIGYGGAFRSSTPSTPGVPEPPTIDLLRGQIGPSLRHWVTPSFAIGGTGGVRLDQQSVETETSPGMSEESSLTVTTLFMSLQMTGVF